MSEKSTCLISNHCISSMSKSLHPGGATFLNLSLKDESEPKTKVGSTWPNPSAH